MIDRLIARVPEAWRDLAELVAAPIVWVPRLQQMLFSFFLDSSSVWSAAAKYVLLLFPVLLGLSAVWCTVLSIYTLPFRAGRTRIVSLFRLAWWDAARAVWMYWVGMARFAAVAVGWALGAVRLALRLVVGLVRDLATAPFAVTGRLTRGYFQPGVPWVAFAMLIVWCVLEAAVFAYTLEPRVTELVGDLVGTEDISRLTGPVLYILLLVLIVGSFACVQALADAVRKRETKFLAQIVLIELFAIFFEVMFLYRGLVEVTMPWMAADPRYVLATATLGWLGVRGLTWFLFGQYGTPPLVAVIARQPIIAVDAPRPMTAAETGWWQAFEDFKGDIEWFHQKSNEALELLALPVLQLLGAALNFAMILTTSRPVFSLPFESLKEVTATRDLEATLHLEPRKQAGV
jgi:hypothetical protein